MHANKQGSDVKPFHKQVKWMFFGLMFLDAFLVLSLFLFFFFGHYMCSVVFKICSKYFTLLPALPLKRGGGDKKERKSEQERTKLPILRKIKKKIK